MLDWKLIRKNCKKTSKFMLQNHPQEYKRRTLLKKMMMNLTIKLKKTREVVNTRVATKEEEVKEEEGMEKTEAEGVTENTEVEGVTENIEVEGAIQSTEVEEKEDLEEATEAEEEAEVVMENTMKNIIMLTKKKVKNNSRDQRDLRKI